MNVFKNKKLKELRKDAGFTQLQFAEKIGVARTTYAEYEQGKIQPPIDKIQRICRIFSINMSDLMEVTNDTGIDVSSVLFKANLSDNDKILRIQQIQEKRRILDAIRRARTILNNSELTLTEKTMLNNVLAYVASVHKLTPADKDIIMRIERSGKND